MIVEFPSVSAKDNSLFFWFVFQWSPGDAVVVPAVHGVQVGQSDQLLSQLLTNGIDQSDQPLTSVKNRPTANQSNYIVFTCVHQLSLYIPSGTPLPTEKMTRCDMQWLRNPDRSNLDNVQSLSFHLSPSHCSRGMQNQPFQASSKPSRTKIITAL